MTRPNLCLTALFAIPATLISAVPAHAAIPEPVRAMIDAAIATGDVEKVRTVTEIAAQTNPDDAVEIAAIAARFAEAQQDVEAQVEAQEMAAMRRAGVFSLWSGEGEVGAFLADGNSNQAGLSGKLVLTRDGLDWHHTLRARAEYQRSDGETSREKFLVAYEPHFDLSSRTYVYGLGQWERDRIQGFSARYSASAGIGYRLFDRDGLHLEVTAGPAWRRTIVIDAVDEKTLAARGALDFDWRVAPAISLTQEATAFVDGESSTYTSASGIEADIGDGLKARLSYTIEHETDPPEGTLKTDTLSRFTLIFGF